MTKADVDRAFSQLKWELLSAIELGVPEGKQLEATKNLMRQAVERTRITVLRLSGIEKEGEYHGHGQRRAR